MSYTVNKGIGKSLEFKGLQAQYLVIFAVGLFASFITFLVMYMASVPQWFCITFLVITSIMTVVQTFRLNKKHGRYGLMKLAARKSLPCFIINRKAIKQLFKESGK